MKSIESRLEKLESAILGENDGGFECMTVEDRRHRVAELIYIGLCDKDLKAMNMTQTEFVSMYLSMNLEDREIKYDRPIYKQLTGKELK